MSVYVKLRIKLSNFLNVTYNSGSRISEHKPDDFGFKSHLEICADPVMRGELSNESARSGCWQKRNEFSNGPSQKIKKKKTNNITCPSGPTKQIRSIQTDGK